MQSVRWHVFLLTLRVDLAIATDMSYTDTASQSDA
jgi:hypothetical protein